MITAAHLSVLATVGAGGGWSSLAWVIGNAKLPASETASALDDLVRENLVDQRDTSAGLTFRKSRAGRRLTAPPAIDLPPRQRCEPAPRRPPPPPIETRSPGARPCMACGSERHGIHQCLSEAAIVHYERKGNAGKAKFIRALMAKGIVNR